MSWKPSYATLEQMHDWLRLYGQDDTQDDDLLTLALSAASRAVDAACGPKRQFGQVDAPLTRTYRLRWSRTLQAHVAEIDDLADPTGLTFSVDDDATTLDTDRYKLRPRNAIADGMVYDHVIITGAVAGCGCAFGMSSEAEHPDLTGFAKWGWLQPWPDPITQATLLQTSRLNIRRDSPYGIAGGPDSGTELRLLERLDPDIAPIVANYVRRGWAAR